MNAMSGPFIFAPVSGDGAAPAGPAGAIAPRWLVLHQAAAVVASLAGVDPQAMRPELRDFPSAIEHAGGWRLARVQEALGDLSSVMESGVAALLALNNSGTLSSAAAAALWEEFEGARAALLALLPPPEEAAV